MALVEKVIDASADKGAKKGQARLPWNMQ